ncbi:MAG: hypothetical protein IPI81_09050 [Flavobacteriales bacterium]|nr:hypothetical protein [Flavobacteriales bacterium]MCC6939013.1 hypothetical protein [Flavobacteriales bacterium]
MKHTRRLLNSCRTNGVVVHVVKHLRLSDAQCPTGVVSNALVELGAGSHIISARIVHYHHSSTGWIFRSRDQQYLWAVTTLTCICMQRWRIEQLFTYVKPDHP